MTTNRSSTRRFRDRGIAPDGRDLSGSAYVQRIVVDRRIADLVAEASRDRGGRSDAAHPSFAHRLGHALGGLAHGAARSGPMPARPMPARPCPDGPARPACAGPSSTA